MPATTAQKHLLLERLAALRARTRLHLAIDGVRSKAKLNVVLVGPGNAQPVVLRPGVPTPLPQSGNYRLQVDNDSENDVPYALSLVIR